MTAIDYCTLADVEAYAGVDFSDGIGPTDAQILLMIGNASRLMDAYAGKQFAGAEQHEEWFDTGFGSSNFTLSERPVISITSFHIVSSSGVETLLSKGRVGNTNDYYLADPEAGLIRMFYAFQYNAQSRLKAVYQAGATTPPADVKMATILHVVRSCARAAMNDENCMERVKEFWIGLLKDSNSEYRDLLEMVKSHHLIGVASWGQNNAPQNYSGIGRGW